MQLESCASGAPRQPQGPILSLQRFTKSTSTVQIDFADSLKSRQISHLLEVDQVRQLKQLQEENTRLKQLVADLTLDKAMLQDVLAKKC
jgi:cell division protein FtsB